jgi:regulator of RNase E activity RraA
VWATPEIASGPFKIDEMEIHIMADEQQVASGNSVLETDEQSFFDTLQRELYTGVLSDVLDSLGYRNQAMDATIRPVVQGFTVVGRAHTLLTSDSYSQPDDPYGLEIAAIDAIKPSDVVVAATNKSTRTCIWGELLSTAARGRGGRGAIIEGYTRDVRMIEEMGFPVFATGMRPVDSSGRSVVVSFGQPIEVGGVVVTPGDIVFGDVDGIVVVPQAVEAEAIRLATEKVHSESSMRDQLLSGRTLRDVYDEFGIL